MTPKPLPTISQIVTSPEVHRAHLALRRALKAEYGSDYAYLIMGNGYIIASDTRMHGVTLSRARGSRKAKAK